MKRASKPESEPGAVGELCPEYSFDYRKSRPNRFAGQIDTSRTVVVLDPDISEVFTTPESVNAVLRALITTMPTLQAGPDRGSPSHTAHWPVLPWMLQPAAWVPIRRRRMAMFGLALLVSLILQVTLGSLVFAKEYADCGPCGMMLTVISACCEPDTMRRPDAASATPERRHGRSAPHPDPGWPEP